VTESRRHGEEKYTGQWGLDCRICRKDRNKTSVGNSSSAKLRWCFPCESFARPVAVRLRLQLQHVLACLTVEFNLLEWLVYKSRIEEG
jgi:hypothetical protein